MAYAKVSYMAGGVTPNFGIPFPYLQRAHIVAKVGLSEVQFTWIDSSTISISPTPAAGSIVRISRYTPRDFLITDFDDGAVLTENDLDTAALQNFYIAQEFLDEFQTTLELTDRIDDLELRLDANIDEIELDVDNLQIEDVRLNDEIVNLSSLIASLNAWVLTIDNALSIVSDEVSAQDIRIATLESFKASAETSIGDLNNRVAALEAAGPTDTAALEESVTDLETSVTNLQTQVTTIEGNLSTLVIDVNTLTNNYNSFASQFPALIAGKLLKVNATADGYELIDVPTGGSGGGLTAVVDDPAPVLGGDLSAYGRSIAGAKIVGGSWLRNTLSGDTDFNPTIDRIKLKAVANELHISSGGGTPSLGATRTNFLRTISANTTISFSPVSNFYPGWTPSVDRFVLFYVQDAIGGHSVNFYTLTPGAVVLPAGFTPTTTAGRGDIVEVLSFDVGQTWYLNVIAQNVPAPQDVWS